MKREISGKPTLKLVDGEPTPKFADRTLTLLTKNMLDPCVLTADGFVTQGHWALKLDRVRNAEDFASDQALARFLSPRTEVKRVAAMPKPKGPLKKYIATDILIDAFRYQGRLLEAVSGAQVAVINRRFLAIGQVDEPGATLYAAGPLTMFLDQPTSPSFIVAPMRHEGGDRARRLVALLLPATSSQPPLKEPHDEP